MDNGRLESPNVDDRLWQDIVDEAKALIPRYNPDWTDHNPTDLGITLIELFAWLVEGMIYRLNQVPDKNFIEFLNLIGITRDPATPATVLLTYQLANGAAPIIVAKGSQAATQQTEKDAPIIFEIDEDVQLLPIATAVYMSKNNGVIEYQNVTDSLLKAPLSGITFSIPPGSSVGIDFGFDFPIGPTTAQEIKMFFQFKSVPNPINPLYSPLHLHNLQIQWLYSSSKVISLWPQIPNVVDRTEGFTKNGGIVTLSVPADWGAQNPQTDWPSLFFRPTSPADVVNQKLFWIGIQVSNLDSQGVPPLLLQIASILFNTVPATNALTVTQPELLGTSNGQPFQFFDLKNVPLYQRPNAPDPYDHLIVEVRTPQLGGAFSPWAAWSRVDDFAQGENDASSYRLDPVTGRISFGNYDVTLSPDGHGLIPPSESEIHALTYRFVAGDSAGNVPPGTITIVRSPVAGVVGVTNLAAAENGADQESIEDTKRRGPEALRNQYRAVTVEDYEYLAGEATTEVKKLRCLAERTISENDVRLNSDLVQAVGFPWTFGGLIRDLGNVWVIVIPGGKLSDPTPPTPSAQLLEQVADYLEERRVISTALHVTGPRYLPIKVIATINVWRHAVDTGLVPDPTLSTQFRDGMNDKINLFLHPVLGNTDGNGWEIGQDQTITSIFEFIKPADEIGFISDLQIEAQSVLYTRPYKSAVWSPTGPPIFWVKFADYEMVCSAGTHSITVSVT